MISPGRSQITPEPELPIEPRTSTTLRATSRASSPNASEICVARASTSSVMARPLSTLVGPRCGRDGDVAQVATADELDTSKCVDRLGTECHLQRLAVFDSTTANREQNVAEQQTALFGGCAGFDTQQHQAAGLGEAQARAQRFLQLDRLRAHAQVGAM